MIEVVLEVDSRNSHIVWVVGFNSITNYQICYSPLLLEKAESLRRKYFYLEYCAYSTLVEIISIHKFWADMWQLFAQSSDTVLLQYDS